MLVDDVIELELCVIVVDVLVILVVPMREGTGGAGLCADVVVAIVVEEVGVVVVEVGVVVVEVGVVKVEVDVVVVEVGVVKVEVGVVVVEVGVVKVEVGVVVNVVVVEVLVVVDVMSVRNQWKMYRPYNYYDIKSTVYFKSRMGMVVVDVFIRLSEGIIGRKCNCAV